LDAGIYLPKPFTIYMSKYMSKDFDRMSIHVAGYFS